MGELKSVYNTLVGKPEGKRLHGRPRRRWENIAEWILEKFCGKVWTGCVCLRVGTNYGLL
jgi:hypothetical protein